MNQIKQTNKDIINIWSKSPTKFIKAIWWLTPQKILPKNKDFYLSVLKRAETDDNILWELKNDMFEPFKKGQQITWQQALIIRSLERAVNWEWRRNISIRTWHGIWKSNIMSKVIIWFLFCHYKSKIWLTAPDAQTLYDALFSEVGKALWDIKKEEIKSMFDKTTDYLRVVWAEDDWFARCKTGKKENPEALAWLHADNIMLIGEEASWIPEEIFTSWQSNLTWDLSIFILIWNPLRNIGFFYETFGDPDWANLHFDGEQSPITWDYPSRISKKYGKDSDEYRRRVWWHFPREDILDTKGYVQLIMKDDIKKQAWLHLYWERKMLWVDCAWAWKDLTTWVLRDNIWSVIVWSEKISDPQSIATKTLTLMKHFWVEANDVIIDNFWAGANVWMLLAKVWYMPRPIYVWEKKIWGKEIIEDGQKMLNLRSLLYWRAKKWIEWWGILDENESWKELEHIRYKRNLNDQIQIMSKEEMRKEWYKSPDFADAHSLTFIETDLSPKDDWPINFDYSWGL